jgi:methyl-accepting chemotaxis protein
MSDLGDQLQLNLEINRLVNERNSLLIEQANIISQQIELQRILCDAMDCRFGEEHAEGIRAISDSMLEASDRASMYRDRLDLLTNSLTEGGDVQDRMNSSMSRGTKMAAMFAAGLKLLSAALNRVKTIGLAVFGFAKSLIGGIFSIGKAILALPLQIHKGLIETANQFNEISPVALALEEVRKQFGDLQVSTGAIIKDSIGPMRAEFNQLAASGHSFAKTFGMGREGVAAAIKFNAELMGALKGGTYELRKEIGENIAEHAIYRKSLGMTAEQQANLIHLAKQQGKSATEVQQEYAKFALGMGKRFGFSAKELGSSMAEMSADVANFGTLSTKKLAQVAVYTKKLGIETKNLQNIVNKYDNFEDAAKSASMLNQTFGMQVDVLKMLREEDPAKRLRMLQDSFAATGRSYDKLSRVERKRLADLSGLDDATARAAFSQQGLSMSYDDIVSAGDDTENSTKSLDNTMKELSKNMERVLQVGKTFSSFWEAFVEGFSFGFFRLTPVTKLLSNIRESMRITYQEGKGFGQLFYEAFPGVKEIVEGLTLFYDPAKFKARFDKLYSVFEKFFNIIKNPKNIRSAFNNLSNEITKMLKDMFNPNNPEYSTMAQGFDSFATTIGNIFIVALEKAFRTATDFLRNFTKNLKRLISGEITMGELFSSMFGEGDIGTGLKERFGENLNFLGEAVEEFGPAMVEAFQALFEYMKPHLKKAVAELTVVIWEGIKEGWNRMPEEAKWAAIALVALKYSSEILAVLASITSLTSGIISAVMWLGGALWDLATSIMGIFFWIGKLKHIFRIFSNILSWGRSILRVGNMIMRSFNAISRAINMVMRLGNVIMRVGRLIYVGVSAIIGAIGALPAAIIAAVIAIFAAMGASIQDQMDRVGGDLIKSFGELPTKAAAALSAGFRLITFNIFEDEVYDLYIQRFICLV